jgi:signal peptidase I
MLRSESSPQPSARRKRLLALAVAVICVLASVRAQYRLGVTAGKSMLPTLCSGDLLIIDKTAYRQTEPKRGDIVVARYHDEFIVKRIVALPGEEVEVRNGRVYVNDTPLAEIGQVIDGDLDISPGRLLPGKFAVLGDNRAVSLHAIIPKAQIVGRVDGHIALKGIRALSAVWAADSSASKSSSLVTNRVPDFVKG